jgi:hypothetical protein
MTLDQALAAAVQYTVMGDGQPPPTSDATATKLSYQAAMNHEGIHPPQTDPRIAPSRCVWLVTVDAPYAGLGGMPCPHGCSPPRQSSSYTAILDANSGFLIEIDPHYP